jgi:hypothetical protein
MRKCGMLTSTTVWLAPEVFSTRQIATPKNQGRGQFHRVGPAMAVLMVISMLRATKLKCW